MYKKKFIVIFLLVLFSVCIAFNSAQAKESKKDNVYISSQKDYSIIFPKKWKVKVQNNKTIIALNLREFGKVSINIVAQPIKLPEAMTDSMINNEMIETVLGKSVKNRIKEGVRQLDGEKAFWHILNMTMPTSVENLSMAIYQVICYQDNMFYIISCNAAAETTEMANDKLKQYRPIFLESIKSFRFLKKRVAHKRKIIFYLLALVLCPAISWLCRAFLLKKALNSYASAFIAALFWGICFLVFYFLLDIKIAFMSLSPLFLTCFYILSPYYKTK